MVLLITMENNHFHFLFHFSHQNSGGFAKLRSLSTRDCVTKWQCHCSIRLSRPVYTYYRNSWRECSGWRPPYVRDSVQPTVQSANTDRWDYLRDESRSHCSLQCWGILADMLRQWSQNVWRFQTPDLCFLQQSTARCSLNSLKLQYKHSQKCYLQTSKHNEIKQIIEGILPEANMSSF